MKENITLTLKANATSIDSKKDGTKLINQYGKAYWLCKAETVEEGFVTWFGNKASELKAGEKITGNLETKVTEKDGKTYTNKNFTFPKKNEGIDPEAFIKLSNRVTTLEMSESRRDKEFKEFLVKLKNDIVLEQTGKVNLRNDLEKSDANMEIVKKQLGISDEPEIDSVPLDVYKDEIDF